MKYLIDLLIYALVLMLVVAWLVLFGSGCGFLMARFGMPWAVPLLILWTVFVFWPCSSLLRRDSPSTPGHDDERSR
jgi:hypothetical protein